MQRLPDMIRVHAMHKGIGNIVPDRIAKRVRDEPAGNTHNVSLTCNTIWR